MQRLTVMEPRVISLMWMPDAEAYEFRLMSGNRYLTPKLVLTPLDWHNLKEAGTVRIADWIALRQKDGWLQIGAIQALKYKANAEPDKWPQVRFTDLYTLAEYERGAKPETGWEKAERARLAARNVRQ